MTNYSLISRVRERHSLIKSAHDRELTNRERSTACRTCIALSRTCESVVGRIPPPLLAPILIWWEIEHCIAVPNVSVCRDCNTLSQLLRRLRGGVSVALRVRPKPCRLKATSSDTPCAPSVSGRANGPLMPVVKPMTLTESRSLRRSVGDTEDQ